MLFMGIFTWEPEKVNEVVKRHTEWKSPAGMKGIGAWTDLTGHRCFTLFETDDPKVILATTVAWSDLGKFDTVPVMKTEDALKLAPKA